MHPLRRGGPGPPRPGGSGFDHGRPAPGLGHQNVARARVRGLPASGGRPRQVDRLADQEPANVQLRERLSLEALTGRTGAVQHRAGTRVAEEVIIRTLESAPKGADGISCEVVAPAMVPRRARDGVKTDPGCGLAGGRDWHRYGLAEV